MTKRKIVQVSVAARQIDDAHPADSGETMIVLCSDGSLWVADDISAIAEWHRIPDVPQDEEVPRDLPEEKADEVLAALKREVEGTPKCFDCKWPVVNCQCSHDQNGHINLLRRLQGIIEGGVQ